MLCEEVLKESEDHRLGQGIWKTGCVWKDSTGTKDATEMEGRVSGGNQSNRKESEMKVVRA